VRSEITLFYSKSEIFIWRQEGRNAKEISNRGAELYDKLVGFIADLQRVGERIQQAQDSYIEARKKFSEGSGNVIRQAEMLKQLGVKYPSNGSSPQWKNLSRIPDLRLPGLLLFQLGIVPKNTLLVERQSSRRG